MSPIFSLAYTQSYQMTDILLYPYLHIERLSNILYGLDHMDKNNLPIHINLIISCIGYIKQANGFTCSASNSKQSTPSRTEVYSTDDNIKNA
jgi:hypothetical protein